MKRKRSPEEELEVLLTGTPGPSSSSSSRNIDPDRLLIDERKKEKRRELKEKFQQKLKTIRDRRMSGVNHEPFPEGAFELLANNQIWEEVLGYLTDPSDVTSAYYTCTTFAEILKERRALMLLPKMLKTVKASSPPEVWKPILLRSRLVCKAWRNIANFHLFDSEFAEDDWFQMPEMPSPNDSYWRSTACVFDDEESVDRATSVLSSQCPHLTPSFSVRNVMVILNDKGATEGFFRKVVEFLQKHGNSVWFFYFRWSWRYNRSFGESYERLRSMLQCLPHLKGLSLNDFKSEVRTVGETNNFRERSRERPLPDLDSLEHFGCHFKDDSLLSQVFQKCINLRSVIFRLVSEISHETAQALGRLTLERLDHNEYLIILSPSATNFRTRWPLKHLVIDLGHIDVVNASLLLPVLNRFRETLEILKIRGVKILKDGNTRLRQIRLDLPQLKSLCLQSIGRECETLELNDLILLKSLEELSVIDNVLGVWDGWSKNRSAEVEVMVVMARIIYYMKNGIDCFYVWKWFPNLKRLELSHNWIFHRTDSDRDQQ